MSGVQEAVDPCGIVGNPLEDCSLVAKILKSCESHACVQREEEKRRELKRQQELLVVAQQHYNRVLLRRGLALWKRLVQLQKDAAEVSYLIGSVGASAGSRKLRSEPLLKIRRAQKKKKL